MTNGTKSAAGTGVGRERRAIARKARLLLRTTGRWPAPRSLASNARDAVRRAAGWRAKAGREARNGVCLGMLCVGLDTAADRIAVCSLEKESFPGGRKLESTSRDQAASDVNTERSA